MAAPTPTRELTKITAGDTAKWTRTVSDYPASDGWTLHYSLRSGSAAIDFTSTADGSNHSVEVAASETANWFPGDYTAIGYVTNIGGERYTVWNGQIRVEPDLATVNADHDPRSQAKKILDYIDSVAAKVAQKQVVSSSVAGVSLTFKTMAELIDARNYWLGIYTQEQNAIMGRARGGFKITFTAP